MSLLTPEQTGSRVSRRKSEITLKTSGLEKSDKKSEKKNKKSSKESGGYLQVNTSRIVGSIRVNYKNFNY